MESRLALSDPQPEPSLRSVADDAVAAPQQGGAPAQRRRLKVMVDALNRDLEHGTGISTYSRQLVRALNELGHETHWLFARSTPKNADALTGEVTFFDRAPPMSRIGQLTYTAKRLAGGFFGATSIEATPVRTGGAVVVDPLRSIEAGGYNAPDLYERAHFKHSMRGKFINIKMRDHMDVLHLTSPLPVRLKNVKTAVTIHDLIPLRLPYTTLDNKREVIRRLRTTVANADRIITVSESSKTDIVNILDVDPAKISVTYQATDLEPLRLSEHSALPRVLARHGLEHRRYILFVSAIEPKKNLRRLIEAFLDVDTSMPLVIVGKRAWMWEREIGDLEAVFGARAVRRLRFIGYVPRADLRFLYAGASFLTFPSLYEGFGLPALEAMKFGCPVLTSNSSSLPEICGDAALYVDPFDRDDIREKIERLAAERDLRKWLSDAGREQAEKFTFPNYVRKLGEAYAEIGQA